MSKSPSLRRIQADIRELALDPSDRYHAAPLESDMFEWHFTIRGADGTDFEGGVYHGRIMLPPEYPFKPPHIIFLTPSGRFETNTKVCLSFSAYHPELWQPAWGIRLILEALISFLPTPADGAIGALDWTSAERKRLAQRSVNYSCATCGCKAIDLLPKIKPKAEGVASAGKKSRFQKEIEKLQELQNFQHGQKEGDDKDKKKEGDSKKSSEEKASPKDTAATATSETTTPPNEKEPPLTGEQGTKEGATGPKVAAKVGQPFFDTTPQPETPKQESEDPTETDPTAVNDEEFRRQVIREELLRGTRHPIADAPPETQAMIQAERERQERNQAHEMADPAPPRHEVPIFPQQNEMPDDGVGSWMSDPVLHGIIIVLAILCFLLMRKLTALKEELDALNEVVTG